MSVMRCEWRWILGALTALCCTNSEAAGILKLSRTEMTISPGKPACELVVENAGDTPLYLSIEQHLVENPGETPEHLVAVSEVMRPGLLISPDRLTVAPGQQYRMIVKVLNTPAQLQVWRVTFRPSERIVVEATQSNGVPAPLFVSVGYGAVIYQLSGDRSPQ
ncbi:hypothetical protein WJ78_01945 [Burkholderia ubonensis]|nr:hypothetical protein [Burkholderia ubonensis]KVO66610.1 hypothetical protein WJ78_01945 [Burkholderia ubonensis]KVO82750.1 hypothetical protein WJ81_23845 [Burkholderia ubonensis]KVP12680.1 hypothetical protein WJ84_22860 [Burkholderia ubonensis]KVP92411.1 hypothetical protein WJ97_22255 [Burkholderia ubonensis]KVR66960.1 hypothetical protein WK20_06835 [Burkholderia ubonensis]